MEKNENNENNLFMINSDQNNKINNSNPINSDEKILINSRNNIISDINVRNYMTKQIELKLHNQEKEILQLIKTNDLLQKNQSLLEEFILSLKEKITELKEEKILLKEENVNCKSQIEAVIKDNTELKIKASQNCNCKNFY